jgi:Ras-related protein Rab-4B
MLCVIYIYNHISRDTFLGVRSWLTDVRALANPEIVILLVGNKNDKGEEREVSYLEASRFAQEHGKNKKKKGLYIYYC